MNNYEKSIKKIENSNFTIKGLKTFIGREGHGVNANLYYRGKKVAFLLDSANGGGLDIDWVYNHKSSSIPMIVRDAQLYMKELITSLPKTMWSELGKDFIHDGLDEYLWEERNVCDELINYALKVKDYNKWLKNVIIFDKKTKKINHYQAKAKDLYSGKEVMVNGVKWDLRKFFLHQGVILNELKQKEAYNYLDKYK